MCTTTDLVVGRVIELFKDDQCKPPKSKICIIVGFCEEQEMIATVYINTEVNINFINSAELKNLQYELKMNHKNEFLRHDSFVDCSDLKYRSLTNTAMAVRKNGRLHGIISITDLNELKKRINAADSIPEYFKELYKLNNQ